MEKDFLNETNGKYKIIWRMALDGKMWARIKKTRNGEEFGKWATKKDAFNFLKCNKLI